MFARATFSDTARFTEATFSGDTEFIGATYSDTARFNEATFTAPARFNEATFSSAAWFNEATFTAPARFNGVRVLHLDDLDLNKDGENALRVWPEGWTVRANADDPSRGMLVPSATGVH